MKKSPLSLIMLAVVLLVVGCALQGADRAPLSAERVAPVAQVTLGENGTIDVAMGFANRSNQPVPRQDDLAGQWVLVNAGGEVRARGRVSTAGPLEADETAFPLVWSGVLDSGLYTLKWGAPAIGTLTVEFTVFDDGAGVGVVRQATSDRFLIDREAETGGQ